jgi:hypothetical protein
MEYLLIFHCNNGCTTRVNVTLYLHCLSCYFDPLFGIVTLGTGWTTEESLFDSEQGQEICLSSITYRSDHKALKPDDEVADIWTKSLGGVF